MEKDRDMDNALNGLFDAIARDYAEWRSRGDYGSPSDYDEFVNKLYVEEGRKYLKIVKDDGQQMVWGFIVKEDDKKFKAGDILKAASWAAPARNKPRGNILDEDFSWVRWTGPEYL
jgi:hypothetical protein